MKTLFIISIAIGAFAVSSCNNNTQTAPDKKAGIPTSEAANNKPAESVVQSPVAGILDGYLQLKNALANDKSDAAANEGKTIMEAVDKVDTATFTPDQKKTFEGVVDDIKENAEHISKNSGKIAHQREHFDMLSQDMNDLVTKFKTGRVLYKDFCPMYNDNKGAVWFSEYKEIKNPYLGKKMPDCGEVKEEIK